jgi:hypothetical protein
METFVFTWAYQTILYQVTRLFVLTYHNIRNESVRLKFLQGLIRLFIYKYIVVFQSMYTM